MSDDISSHLITSWRKSDYVYCVKAEMKFDICVANISGH